MGLRLYRLAGKTTGIAALGIARSREPRNERFPFDETIKSKRGLGFSLLSSESLKRIRRGCLAPRCPALPRVAKRSPRAPLRVAKAEASVNRRARNRLGNVNNRK